VGKLALGMMSKNPIFVEARCVSESTDCDIFHAAFAFELIANLIGAQFPYGGGGK